MVRKRKISSGRRNKLEKAKKIKKPGIETRSMWVFNWFNSCGFTELISVVGSRWDMERFGMIVTGTPRHADVLFIAGYQTVKSIKRAKRIYEQMPGPKVVVALGSCSMTGGMYWDSYNTIKKLDDYIPVDLYIPGCPPRPEAIFEGIQRMIEHVHKSVKK